MLKITHVPPLPSTPPSEQEPRMNPDRRHLLALAATLAATAGIASGARAADAEVIEARVERALQELFASVDGAADLYENARGVLIMPEVTKAGLLVGGAYGEGALRVGGQTVGYYSVAAASFGLQAGVQSSKQALFFMTDESLARFRAADGWEIGADAEFTLPGKGVNIGVDSTTRRAPVVAVVFGQDGIMAGASIEGAKYSPIQR
jgi:lipid-binding SYLF domain-containing protein